MSTKPAVAIIGAGRVGTALGILLHRRGYPIRGVVCRSLERAEASVRLIGQGVPCTDAAFGAAGAQVVLITVPDGAIVEAARQVRTGRRFGPGDLLVHTSGALPASVLRGGAPEDGGGCLSMHPIQSVAEPRSGAERLVGAYFGLEGDPQAVEAGERIVADIGGVPLRLAPGAKALYHAAACVASNYLVTLIDVSLRLLEQAGVGRRDGLAALERLISATAANAAALGVPEALTGPIERGDAQTIDAHLEALGSLSPGAGRESIEAVYRALGLATLSLALRKKAQEGTAPGRLGPGYEQIERMLTAK